MLTGSLAALAGPGVGSQANAAAAATSSVRVATFNIQNVSLDRTVGEQRPWRQRRATIISEIFWNRLDVVGLQEANPSGFFASRYVNGRNQFLDLRNGLNARGVAYAVTNSAAADCVNPATDNRCVRRDRNASGSDRILYNTKTLALVSEDAFKYKAQVGTSPAHLAYAVFRVKPTGKQFLFTTTHLAAQSEPVRFAQLREMIAKVNAVKGSLPVVSVGDFNIGSLNPASRKLLPAMRAAGFGDVLNRESGVHPIRAPRAKRVLNGWLNSVNRLSRDVAAVSFDTNRARIGNHVDYIFASNNLPVTEFKVVFRFDPKTLRVTGVLPSDHNLVRATLVI